MLNKTTLKEAHDTYKPGTELTIKKETANSYIGEIEFFGYTIDNIEFPKRKCEAQINNFNPMTQHKVEEIKTTSFGIDAKIIETLLSEKKESKEEPKTDGSFDSTVDTLKHIKRVNQLLTEAAAELIKRANCHDDSKLVAPEKELFDKLTPMLAKLTYGSDEYKASLAELKPALDHHYENNTHHPEHYKNGIDGMDIFDVLEMAVDWCAAGERHEDGDIFKSLEINTKRFNISDQLVNILANTFKKLQNDGKIRK